MMLYQRTCQLFCEIVKLIATVFGVYKCLVPPMAFQLGPTRYFCQGLSKQIGDLFKTTWQEILYGRQEGSMCFELS